MFGDNCCRSFAILAACDIRGLQLLFYRGGRGGAQRAAEELVRGGTTREASGFLCVFFSPRRTQRAQRTTEK